MFICFFCAFACVPAVERTAFVRKVDDGLKIKGGEVKEAVLRELRLGPQSAVFLARSLQSSVIRVVDLYGNSLGDYGEGPF